MPDKKKKSKKKDKDNGDKDRLDSLLDAGSGVVH